MQCPAGDPVCRDPPARGHHTGFICGGNLSPCGAAGERSEFNIKPPLGAPLLIFPRGYPLKSFPRVDTSARQRGFEIRVFPLLGELPKAIQYLLIRGKSQITLLLVIESVDGSIDIKCFNGTKYTYSLPV